MPEAVHCPSCDLQLRVPDELIGKKVKCPTCGTNFMATSRSQAAREVANVEPVAESVRHRDLDTVEAQVSQEEPLHPAYRRQALNSAKLPAIFLLVTGILGFLGSSWSLVNVLLMPPPTKEEIKAMAQALSGFGVTEASLQDSVNMTRGQTGALINSAFVFLSVLTIAGAIAMLSGRARWLGIIGSLTAMVNFQVCCCAVGLPIGIWSLVVLLNADVKNAFR
jgi:predicted Zn finger-like uncharacterized protein